MKATIGWIAPLVTLALATPYASAQYYSPVMRVPLGHAPDTYGPGFYVVCPGGQTIGPNYYLRPCFPPFQGVLPVVTPYKTEQGYQFRTTPTAQHVSQLPQLQRKGGGQGPGPGMGAPNLQTLEMFPMNGGNGNGEGKIGLDVYPYHPFVRSPRDFFMFRENMEDQARMLRPNLVP